MTRRIKSKILILHISLFCLSCKTNYENFSKKSDKKQLVFIENNLNNLGGSDLGNFIYQLKQENVDFTTYTSQLREKIQNSQYPYDIYILSDLLLQHPENKTYMESVLNDKISIWDTGNWGNKFWAIIKNEKLNIKQPYFYKFKDGLKIYDFDNFLKTKIQKGELGQNPALFLNDQLKNYKKGNLTTLLKNYEIIQIDYIPINESIGLFGQRGIDGQISVMTK